MLRKCRKATSRMLDKRRKMRFVNWRAGSNTSGFWWFFDSFWGQTQKVSTCFKEVLVVWIVFLNQRGTFLGMRKQPVHSTGPMVEMARAAFHFSAPKVGCLVGVKGVGVGPTKAVGSFQSGDFLQCWLHHIALHHGHWASIYWWGWKRVGCESKPKVSSGFSGFLVVWIEICHNLPSTERPGVAFDPGLAPLVYVKPLASYLESRRFQLKPGFWISCPGFWPIVTRPSSEEVLEQTAKPRTGTKQFVSLVTLVNIQLRPVKKLQTRPVRGFLKPPKSKRLESHRLPGDVLPEGEISHELLVIASGWCGCRRASV